MPLKARHGLEIRAANTADASGIHELLCTAGHDIAPRALADRIDALRQDPGVALLALEWGPPSGLVLLHWYRTLHLEQPTARITTLLVAPDARRRGIGRLLLKAAAQAARVTGCGTLELLAAAEETSLGAFCRANGFTEAGASFMRPLRKARLPSAADRGNSTVE